MTLPGIDLDAVRACLDRERPGLVAGPLAADLIAGGRSNLTYRLTDGVHRWVLRRPPLGHVLATAHDMAREHRVISALAGSPVPVPETVLLCTDSAVLGAPFYVMANVPGVVLRGQEDTTRLGPQRARAVSHALIDVLADLHTLDPAAVGLADFGRPEGYLARQVARWRKQLDASRSRDLPGVDELHARLAAAIPPSARASIVHGDYRLDNVLVDPTAPRITAVLDWEMATLGDPLADLGLFVVYWDDSHGAVDVVTGSATNAPGMPAADDLVRRYAERTGTDVSGLSWYVAFAKFKLAVVLEGIHYRHAQGRTVGTGFDRIGEHVPGLVAGGLSTLDEEA
ncbi:phosphotransferase family protein [Streptoalloteichus hindustanus]|uniref:Predicted kinase, aminoglycoside phosphotransferase (APT) family n=1 Tax=Streptoalloteichus hindustanus TaxID=2017 RepID=A0A1M5FFS2_STRHI|nr:phosphotransferase family protein [Streptoalloteichus hindustanus]SHF90335.1 Predicted kinase, aminoglycoside phosphotransferase (APT) family [Streptoalloteichus hindustanus]